ncbi:MAG: hypothetical protein R2713_05845 [Ilumatobacteraceae bacterium]
MSISESPAPDQTPIETTATTTATADASNAPGGMTFEERRHARNLGISYVVLAGVTALFLTRHEGTATFNLDGGRSFGLPAQGLGWFVAAALAVTAGIQLWRGTASTPTSSSRWRRSWCSCRSCRGRPPDGRSRSSACSPRPSPSRRRSSSAPVPASCANARAW